jgi:hypothetical protein
MDALTRSRRWCRVGWLVVALALFGWAPGTARAQSALAVTHLILAAPSSAQLGEQFTVQALLTDSNGRPISHATVFFAIPTQFLNNNGDMVVAEATSDKNGRVVADIALRSTGAVTLKALYGGDAEYAAASVEAAITVAGNQQLYSEDIGVHIPFFNSPPVLNAGNNITLVGAALWPSMTGWPIAAVLIVIWSLYVLVVARLFRVARPHSENKAEPEAQPGRHA